MPVASLLVLLLADQPTEYAAQLIGEGLIGAVAAAAVNLAVLPPLNVGAADRAIRDVRDAVGGLLGDMSAGITGVSPAEPAGWLRRAKDLDHPLHLAREAVQRGEESTVLNPWGIRARAVSRGQRRTLVALEQVTVVVRDIAATLEDAAGSDEDLFPWDDGFRSALAEVFLILAAGLSSHEGSGRFEETLQHAEELHRRLFRRAGGEAPALMVEGAVLVGVGRAVQELKRAAMQ